LKTSISGR